MEELIAQSPVASSLESPLMSKRTTPSAPASEFGNLAIGSCSSGSSPGRMAVTTRAMYRRHAAPRETPPRAPRQATTGASSRQASQQPDPAAGSEDSASSEEDDDDEDSDDEDGDGEARDRASVSPVGDALRRLNVFDIFALSEPNLLIGRELYQANGLSEETTQTHRRLALVVANQALENAAFYTSLLQTFPVPSAAYTRQMLARMQRRQTIIFRSLADNISNAATGSDVITTASKLRSFTAAIDALTARRHWAVATSDTRRGYASLLLNLLVSVVGRDYNLYAHSPAASRPAYAGQRAEHTNLYLCLIGNPPAGADQSFAITTLSRLDPDGALLANSLESVQYVYNTVFTRHSNVASDGSRTSKGPPQPSRKFIVYLERVYTAVIAQNRR